MQCLVTGSCEANGDTSPAAAVSSEHIQACATVYGVEPIRVEGSYGLGGDEKIKSMLEASESACDDTHKFNPSRFDMENSMRINLKKDCEAPPPEFRKQGHHMLEIIAAQIKEMEDAGWIL